MADSTPVLEGLWPPPRRVRGGGAGLALVPGSVLVLEWRCEPDGRARELLERALEVLGARGVDDAVRVAPVLAVERLAPGAVPAQGYRLAVGAGGITLAASDAAGLAYGACTLLQLARAGAAERRLPGVVIEDAPDFGRRGFMLDVSRDRVPTMRGLFRLVEVLAELKYNELQLYFEHTFAYAGHEEVWGAASAFTPAEVRELDAFCRARHIELVPNQQSFGHMHKWLVHERYRHLAECPEGIEHAFSVAPEPFSLAPTEAGSIELLAELYDQLLPCFTSARFNVGLDETFDLGLGASRGRCAELGVGRVYLEYLTRVHALVRERGKRMEFWGDVIVNHPELVPELPRDAVALEWGYEAGHPFDAHAARFAESGLEFVVCPGTSAWQSFGGRIPNARANLAEAARHGLRHGAGGYLVTDWGDFGHWQPPPVSWPGVLLGAARAWNAAAEPEGLAAGLAAHVLDDASGAGGRALVELGEAYLACDAPAENGAPLFFLMRYAHQPLPIERAPGLNAAGLERHAERLAGARATLAEHSMRAPDAALTARELEWVIDVLGWAGELARARLAAGSGTHMGEVEAGERRRLRATLGGLTETHRALWLERSRPGGLAESAGRFESIAGLLAGAPGSGGGGR